jgi:hypothetical protein
MDEETKQNQENNGETGRGGSHPHVQVFGMDVNTSREHTGASGNHSEYVGDKTASETTSETKEDWGGRKAEWRQKHREHIQQRKEEWKMQRNDWNDDRHHGGGLFFGMILLFAGVVALLYTMGFVSHGFWLAIAPFWPILLILWGASIILGRHWFARFIVFILAIVFLVAVILYGLVKTDSPVVSSLSPTVSAAIQNTHTQY